MKVSQGIKLGAVAIVSVALLAACGSKSGAKDGDQTLNMMQASSLPSMDISKETDVVSGETTNNTNEGLLKFGANSSIKKAVAKSYSVSKDGKTWTFNLRKSNWSDGTPVTAKDFVYSWQRTVNPKTASQYSYLFDHVKNATEIGKKKAPVSSLGVKADGDYKLVVTLNAPQTYFKDLVANPTFFPQSKKVVDKYGSKYGTTSEANVYNGPFKLTKWTGTNDTWTMVKNDKYWDAKNVKLKTINVQTIKDPATALNQYKSGQLDETILNGNQYKNYKSSKELHPRLAASSFYIEMNEKKFPIFKNAKARQAINMVINRDQFANSVLQDGSKPLNSYVPSGFAKNDGKDFATEAKVSNQGYQLEKAQKLWNEAMKEENKTSLSLNLMADDTDGGKKSTEYMQSNLQKLKGLKITAQNLPFKTRLQRSTDRQFDMVISAWGADFPDPISFLSLFTSDNTYNNGQWKNAQYDTYIKNAEGKDANNATKRFDDMVNAQKILTDQAGIAPVYQQVKAQLLKSKVHGIVYFPTGANWDYSHAYISK